MTLEEAIKKEKQVAALNRKTVEGIQDNPYLPESMMENVRKTVQACIDCAEEHEQIVQWLEALLTFRRVTPNIFHTAYAKGKNKTLDELKTLLKAERTELYNPGDDETPMCVYWEDIEKVFEKASEQQ